MILIDKDALVAEIDNRIKKYATIDVGNKVELEALYGAKCHVLTSILSFLDTLEVKEVYLDNHTIMEEIRKCGCNPSEFDVAKHFFELGLKVQKGE